MFCVLSMGGAKLFQVKLQIHAVQSPTDLKRISSPSRTLKDLENIKKWTIKKWQSEIFFMLKWYNKLFIYEKMCWAIFVLYRQSDLTVFYVKTYSEQFI